MCVIYMVRKYLDYQMRKEHSVLFPIHRTLVNIILVAESVFPLKQSNAILKLSHDRLINTRTCAAVQSDTTYTDNDIATSEKCITPITNSGTDTVSLKKFSYCSKVEVPTVKSHTSKSVVYEISLTKEGHVHPMNGNDHTASGSGIYAQATSDLEENVSTEATRQPENIQRDHGSSYISQPTDDAGTANDFENSHSNNPLQNVVHDSGRSHLRHNDSRSDALRQHESENAHAEPMLNNSTYNPRFVTSPLNYAVRSSQLSRRQQTATHDQQLENRLTKPPRYPEYEPKDHRQRTFVGWPRTQPSPATLINNGFFYTKSADLVRCYQCGIGLKDFSNSDDPLKEHVKHSGDCDFLVQLLGHDELQALKSRIQSQDPELNRQKQLAELRKSRGYAPNTFSARHPEYSTKDSRLLTFATWPSDLVQRPAQLADAGLYYTGTEDHVRCFACDGGLRKWDPEDHPWLEHCRWFPACPYIRQTKGDEFIEFVQASANATENTIAGAAANQDSIVGSINNLTLYGPEHQRIIDEHRVTCVDDMGFSTQLFDAAVKELGKQGNVRPTIEEMFTAIDSVMDKERQAEELAKQQLPVLPETPAKLLDENKRLKNMMTCKKCAKNQVNALFLPCTHHRFCWTCSRDISTCPLCNRRIKEKIRTFMS